MDASERKKHPMFRGLLRYFPKACMAVSNCSYVGNKQHNQGQEMHWARDKSKDHGDCILRHQMDAGTMDSDGIRHSTKVAWRALAQLELELEAVAAAAKYEETTPIDLSDTEPPAKNETITIVDGDGDETQVRATCRSGYEYQYRLAHRAWSGWAQSKTSDLESDAMHIADADKIRALCAAWEPEC